MKTVKAVFSTVCAVIAAVALTAVSFDAEAAKRMGGGKSFGKQSGNVTQREAAPTPPATAPAAGAAQSANKPAAAGAAAGATGAAAAAKKPWGAMLGGLAAGLGLAWLASALGFGEAFAQFMLFALLALVIMVVIGFIMRKRAQANQAHSGMSSPYAFGGASAGGAGGAGAAQPATYRPEHVGNDASARPWERNTTNFQASAQQPGSGTFGGSLIGSNLQGSTTSNWSVPADFDSHGFLGAAKQNFITLQSAWDRGDMATLRLMMTDEMLGEIKGQLAERESQSGGQPNQTDVVALDAKLLGIEDLGRGWMASVEFSGMIREDASQSPGPFREVWNMTKPKDGSAGWLVAGLQALN